MTTTKNTPTADELHASLEALEAEEQAEQARQMAIIRQAQTARAQTILDGARALEDQLEQSGDDQYKEAIAAAIRGDLNGAYSGFIGYLGTRGARAQARREMQSAAALLDVNPHNAAELSYLKLSFSDFIDTHLSQAVEAHAKGITDQCLESEVYDIDTAAAYLDQGE